MNMVWLSVLTLTVMILIMPISHLVVKLTCEGNWKPDPNSDESDLPMKAFV